MSAYHVVPSESASLADAVFVTHDSYEARKRADALHQKDGQHYHVVKIETVWTTQTLEDAMNEKVA